MKSLLFLFYPIFFFSQNVGIKTNSPTKTLDVNGNIRVRKIAIAGSSTTKDSVVVFENDGVFKYVSSSKIMQQLPAGTFGLLHNSNLLGDGKTSTPLGLAQMSANANQAIGWNGTSWLPVDQLSSSNWLFVGNSNTDNTNSLGTINDISMSIRSNNTNILQFGRRQTLGLYDSSSTGLYPYNQPDNSVSYVRGTSGISSMQFESSASLSYKPVFYTDTSGNFGFRGSAAGNDWFQVASSGSSNNGSLQFTIGDDGNEPIVFRKFNGSTNSYIELMRMQGTGLDSNVRVGINTNGSLPNSTFQVLGSVSKNITTITANTTLAENHHTVLINNTANITITLPAASTTKGRIYILKKTTASTLVVTTSSYQNNLSVSTTTLPVGVTQLQSDGTNWQQIN